MDSPRDLARRGREAWGDVRSAVPLLPTLMGCLFLGGEGLGRCQLGTPSGLATAVLDPDSGRD